MVSILVLPKYKSQGKPFGVTVKMVTERFFEGFIQVVQRQAIKRFCASVR